MPMVHREETIQVLIRLPRTVKDWVEKEAARYGTSQASEIVRAIRTRMDSEPPKKAG
jgi:hypothetical protein